MSSRTHLTSSPPNPTHIEYLQPLLSRAFLNSHTPRHTHGCRTPAHRNTFHVQEESSAGCVVLYFWSPRLSGRSECVFVEWMQQKSLVFLTPGTQAPRMNPSCHNRLCPAFLREVLIVRRGLVECSRLVLHDFGAERPSSSRQFSGSLFGSTRVRSASSLQRRGWCLIPESPLLGSSAWEEGAGGPWSLCRSRKHSVTFSPFLWGCRRADPWAGPAQYSEGSPGHQSWALSHLQGSLTVVFCSPPGLPLRLAPRYSHRQILLVVTLTAARFSEQGISFKNREQSCVLSVGVTTQAGLSRKGPFQG